MSAAAPASNRYHKGDERARRGWARMRELAAQAEIERREIEAGLLADLGRPATTVDRIAIEALSAAMVRARKLRAMGKSDSEATKLVTQLLRATGIKPAAPAAPQPINRSIRWNMSEQNTAHQATAGQRGDPIDHRCLSRS
jgi:hypothetical protein